MCIGAFNQQQKQTGAPEAAPAPEKNNKTNASKKVYNNAGGMQGNNKTILNEASKMEKTDKNKQTVLGG